MTATTTDTTHDCADDYCVGRDSKGNVRMRGGRGRLIAGPDNTRENVADWFRMSQPGRYREDYRAVMGFLAREAGEADVRPVHPDEELAVATRANLGRRETYALALSRHRVECVMHEGEVFGWHCLTCGEERQPFTYVIETAEQAALAHHADTVIAVADAEQAALFETLDRIADLADEWERVLPHRTDGPAANQKSRDLRLLRRALAGYRKGDGRG